ncbi:outer membrane biogenesis protein [Fuerstiella marisgermanici]|uniref:Outer membrane biogenesis protein n=1 Tax=Fuerstiella marisgermanici TaxID=1891926 RepID=A0A1P8WRT0_9PLAN|nr:outer membrane biogenesis protein [Fuerstiella marisgermanici]
MGSHQQYRHPLSDSTAHGAGRRFAVTAFRLLTLSLIAWLAGDAVAKDTPDVRHPHGPTEFLGQSLVQSQQDARLLAAATARLAENDRPAAFAALLQIFAQPHDNFLPVHPDRPLAATWSSAFELLRKADYATRAEWTKTAESLARPALDAAVASGEMSQLRSVALSFPFTQSAFTADVTRATLAASNGQRDLAAARLAALNESYGQTRVSFPTAETLTTLALQVDRLGNANTAAASRMAGESGETSPGLAQPWPESLWTWRESVWNYPELAAVVAGSDLPENYDKLASNSWQPTLLNDTLYVRTPFRVAAFDKLAGTLKWSVQTDMAEVADPLSRNFNYPGAMQRTSAASLLKMSDLGTLAVDDDYVFFVDRFRNLVPPADPRNLNPAEWNRDGGTRLVAIRFSPSPHVAWTAGDAPHFEYQLTPAQSETSSPDHKADAARVAESQDAELPFRNQSFSGIPLIHEGRLFVLSADSEVIWLSCLTRSTGRIEWQRPLLYQHGSDLGRSGRFIFQQQTPVGASVCGIDGTTIISALKNGVVVGTNVLDGRLLWATNLRDAPATPHDRRRMLIIAFRKRNEGVNSQPLLANGRLYCATSGSDLVHCLNSQTGQIVWQVDRTTTGFGAEEGSQDSYPVAATDQHLVMIGERHIRALDVADGQQIWTQPIQPQTGRATCDGTVCLVPQRDGTIAGFDVATGRRRMSHREIFGQDQPASLGALVSDADVICAITPTSVRVMPTVQFRRRQSSMQGSDGRTFTDAQLDLLDSHTQLGIEKLQALLQYATNSAINSDANRQAADLLAETLLGLIARQQFLPAVSEGVAVPTDAMDQLNRLPLTTNQALRFKILAPEAAHPVSTDAVDRLPLLKMLPDWSARADVLTWMNLAPDQAKKTAPVKVTGQGDFQRIEQAILFPKQAGSTQQQIEFAKSLRDTEQTSAAELVLLAAFGHASTSDRLLLMKELQSLRHVAAISGSPKSDLSKPEVQKSTENESARTSSDAFSDLSAERNFKIEERLSLTARATGLTQQDALSVIGNRAIGSVVATANSAVDTPAWYPQRLFLSGQRLFRVDMATGAVAPPQKLPEFTKAVQIEDGDAMPGLIPLVAPESAHQSDTIGVLSLLEHGGPGVIWSKTIQRALSDRSELQVGPLGPGYLIVATADTLQCLHPFTGNVLWTRRITQSPSEPSHFRSAIRIVGDDEVIAVIGESHQTCQRFRTLDGRELEPLTVAIPQDQTPLVSGRRLLFTQDEALVLLDLLSGRNVLADKPDVKVRPSSGARLLRDRRVVVLTPDLKVVMFNIESASVEWQCEVPDFPPNLEPKGSLSAFERDGRLFVEIPHEGHRSGSSLSMSRMGEPRTSGGTLLCLNSQTGALLWSMPSEDAVVPAIYGDTTSLMIMWSFKDPAERGWERDFRQLRNPNGDPQTAGSKGSMTLRVIDGRTGQQVAKQEHLTRSEPLRCVHDADSQTIKIETAMSEITVQYDE